MNIEELTKRYESACEEVDNLKAAYDAHMMCNQYGRSPNEMTDFYKSLNKIELNLRIKNDEKSQLMDLICSIKHQEIKDELSGNQVKKIKE